MSEYTFEFPNMNATLVGKDGQDITEEQTLFQETYENQGWLFEYGEEGSYRYHWEIDDGLPYIVYISQPIKFPDHSATSTGKDGQDITIFEALEEDFYINNNWDFDEVWELPDHEELTYYLPNLQDLEKSILDPIFLQPFLNIINITGKYEDEIFYTDQFVTTETGEFVIEARAIKGYEAVSKSINVNLDKIGLNIDIVFEYKIALSRLYIDNDVLSLQIASLNKKRDSYKVQRRLLSGQYVTQTIDKGKDIYNIKFYSTEEQKRRLDNYYAAAQKIEYIKNLEITNLKIKKLTWNIFVGGNYEERIYVGQMEATEVRE